MMSKKNIKPVQPTAALKDQSTSINTLWVRILMVVLVFFMYGKSTHFEFTLDDDIFYQKHASVQKGIAGTGELFEYGSMNQFDGTLGVQPYRPITLFSFVLDKQMFDNDPGKSHLMNLVFYILILQILLSLLLKLFPDYNNIYASIVVLLFAVHPLHTEVVSSVKSRDELLAALFGFAAWLKFLPANREEKPTIKNWVYAVVLFFLALLSKESAIAFALLIPLSYLMFYPASFKDFILSLIPFGFMSALFLAMRSYAMYNGKGTPHTMKIPVLDNVLAAATNASQTIATKCEILLYNLKLLFLPWPLSWDYSFNQIPLVDWSHPITYAAVVVLLLLTFLTIFFFKRNPIIAFSILFFFIAIAPTSNILFLNGATLAERFLFVPSFAFALIVVILLQQLLKLDTQTFSGKNKSIFIGIVSIVSALFLMMSSIRCSDWKNNFTLFESGAINAPNSSRTNAALASEYMTLAEKETNMEEKNRLVQNAIASYKKSLNIFPQNSDAAYKVGLIYAMNRDTVNAIKYYKQSLQATAQQIFALNNLGSLYAAQKNYDSAALFFNRSYQADSSNEMTITNLVVVNYLKGNDDQAIYFGNRSLEKNFISSKIYDLLSSCWARKGNNEMAQKYKQLSIDLDNKNKPAYLK